MIAIVSTPRLHNNTFRFLEITLATPSFDGDGFLKFELPPSSNPLDDVTWLSFEIKTESKKTSLIAWMGNVSIISDSIYYIIVSAFSFQFFFFKHQFYHYLRTTYE